MCIDLDTINDRSKFNKLTEKNQKIIKTKHNFLIFLRLLCWITVNYFIFNSPLTLTVLLLGVYPLMDTYELVRSVIFRENVRGLANTFNFINKLIYNPVFFILATIIPFIMLEKQLVKFIKLFIIS